MLSARRWQFFYHGANPPPTPPTPPTPSPDGRDITWEGQMPISLDDDLIYVRIMVMQGRVLVSRLVQRNSSTVLDVLGFDQVQAKSVEAVHLR